MGVSTMGLYLYFFDHETYDLHYNCTFYSVEDMPFEKRRRPIFAAIVFILGVAYEFLYIPCIYAMFKKKVRQAFCYKLMIEMALYDMFTLPLTAFFPAIFSYNGWMFCSYPTVTFLAGGILFPLWIGYSMTSLILAINRCLAFSKYSWIFKGFWREILWLATPPTATITVALFGQSITYNSVLGAWFFNPHLRYYADTSNTYPSTIQFWNNILFCTILPTVYVWFFINNYTLSKKRMSGMSAKEYRLFIQCLVVNFTIVGAAAGKFGCHLI
ncbi:Serpentine Receptor, class T [Aphelenchoides bicaudatus]|nr:Serpentine Receptor, class T [Aphelenchoides bicaudatus]